MRSIANYGSMGKPLVDNGPVAQTFCNAGGTSAGWRANRMINDTFRIEWIEENKPNMWFSEYDQVWVVYTDEVKRFEATTLVEAIDKARTDQDQDQERENGYMKLSYRQTKC